MNIQPTLEFHPHQEFHFAKDTDSKGCCCFWKSLSKKKTYPEEYYVNKKGQLEPFKSTTDEVSKRIKANKRLAKIVEAKFTDDCIENNEAFERLRKRINYNFNGSDRITEEKLISIINAIYEIKKEIKESGLT